MKIQAVKEWDCSRPGAVTQCKSIREAIDYAETQIALHPRDMDTDWRIGDGAGMTLDEARAALAQGGAK